MTSCIKKKGKIFIPTNRLTIEFTEVKNLTNVVENVEFVFDEILLWKVTVIGPQNSPYEGGKFVLYMDFRDNYPNKPPRISLITKIYHPLVD
jgi:ubiquitin-protein ligase